MASRTGIRLVPRRPAHSLWTILVPGRNVPDKISSRIVAATWSFSRNRVTTLGESDVGWTTATIRSLAMASRDGYKFGLQSANSLFQNDK